VSFVANVGSESQNYKIITLHFLLFLLFLGPSTLTVLSCLTISDNFGFRTKGGVARWSVGQLVGQFYKSLLGMSSTIKLCIAPTAATRRTYQNSRIYIISCIYIINNTETTYTVLLLKCLFNIFYATPAHTSSKVHVFWSPPAPGTIWTN